MEHHSHPSHVLFHRLTFYAQTTALCILYFCILQYSTVLVVALWVLVYTLYLMSTSVSHNLQFICLGILPMLEHKLLYI